MATKTFKIGERCVGGIITAEINKGKVAIINKQWDFSQGTRRSSDQTNAKEITRATYDASDPNLDWNIDNFLCDLTTSYHAGLIINWVKSKLQTT